MKVPQSATARAGRLPELPWRGNCSMEDGEKSGQNRLESEAIWT
jgi:hypothetical protein